MKRIQKRACSLLLSLMMIISLLPGNVWAADPPEGYTPPDGWNAGPSLPIGNSNLMYTYWFTYDVEGINPTMEAHLVIYPDPAAGSEGNFAIPDYEKSGDAPWSESTANYVQVFIADGVTGVGDYAFAGMDKIQQITIYDPSDLKSIGNRAFYNVNEAHFVSETTTDSLDLSSVTEMGEYAFYNCDQLANVALSGRLTAVEGEADTETSGKIPQYAFSSCNALTSITIPEGIQTVGQSAFSGCTKASTITLPDSLVTIEASAFACSIDSPNSLISSLTIPQNVQTIGERAFYGYRNMTTVTVESTVMNRPGAAAFGNNELSAYSNPNAQAVIGGITYDYTAGTTFQTQSDEIAKLFVSEDNCYQGNLTPMILQEHKDPTCVENGYDTYGYTLTDVSTDGKPVTVTTTISINALGHDWGQWEEEGASCERDGYFYRVCQRKDCGMSEQGAPEGETAEIHQGHKWQHNQTVNPNIQQGQETTLVYKCMNNAHNNDRDVTDSPLSLSITGITLQGTAGQPISSLNAQLEAISGGFSLQWDNTTIDPDTALSTETTSLAVQARPIYTQGVSSEWISGLTIAVNVVKSPLDLQNVTLSPTKGHVGEAGENTQLLGADQFILGPVTVEYKSDTGSWTGTRPDWIEKNIGDKWQVRATFAYDGNLYELDEDYYPTAEGYTVTDNPDGTVTITHAYEITRNTIGATYTLLKPFYQAGQEQATVRLRDLPSDCTITYTWEDSAGNQISSTTNGNSSTCDIAPFENAGTYPITITIEKENYEPQTIEAVQAQVLKQQVPVPSGKSGLQYIPDTAQTGVEVAAGMDGIYKLTNNTATDAGSYAATAKLTDASNYCWASQSENGSAEVTISWSIAPCTISKPNLIFTSNVGFDGQLKTAVSDTTASDYDGTYDNDGTLTVYYIGTDGKYAEKKVVAYTVTDAQRTDAGTYTPHVTLSTPNFQWAGDTSTTNYEMNSWTISQKQVTYPDITVSDSPTYDGAAFDQEEVYISRGTDVTGLTFVRYLYSTSSNTGFTETPPTNAGTYYVRAEYTVDSNYIVTGTTPTAQLIIQPITLTMAAPTGYDSPLPYTGQAYEISGVTVSGDLAQWDDENDYTISYTYSYRDAQGQEVTTQPSNTPPSLKDLGTYTVTASLTADNYQAASVSYTVTIGQGIQDIALTPAEADEAGWKDEDNDGNHTMTVTLGEAESFTVTGQGTVDLAAKITYAVTDGSEKDFSDNGADIIDVDEDTGLVTVKGAGTAEVTVTAEATDKVGEATATYTVTINKGEAVIERGNVSAQYDGEALGKNDYAATLRAPVDSAPDPTDNLTYMFYQDADCQTPVTDNNGIPSAQGVYYLKISYGGDNNYIKSSKIVTVTISAAELDVTKSDYNDIYDGNTHALAAQVTVKGLNSTALTMGKDYTIVFVKGESAPADWGSATTVNSFKDVADSGTYQYQITAPNYGTVTGSITVTVRPKELTVTHNITDAEKVYDGTTGIDSSNPGLAAAVKDGDQDQNTVSVKEVTASYNSEDVVSANQITVTVTLQPNTGENLGNYTFNGEAADGEDKITLTINDAKITPKPITVTGGINATDKVYDGDGTIALSGTPAVANDAFVSGDKVEFSAISNQTGTVANSDVGDDKEVTVTKKTLNDLLTGADAANYTVSDDYTGATVNITPRTVYLLFPGETTHDSDWEKEVPYSTGGLTSQPDVYRVSAKAKDANSGFVGDDELADGDIAYTFTNSEGSVTNPKNLGIYTVTAALTDEAESRLSNYTIASITGTIEIIKNQDALDVYITPKTDLTYTGEGQDPIDGITVKGGSETLAEGAGYTITYSVNDTSYGLNRTQLTDAIKNAGTYTVNWKVSTINYDDKTGSFTVTVERAVLELSRDVDTTRTYDGTTAASKQVENAELTGQQNDEAISVSVTSAVYDAATVNASKITITYTITAADGASLDNYKVSINGAQAQDAKESMTEEVNATIEPADVTVTIGNQSSVYDGSNPTVEQDEWEATDGTVYKLDGVNDDDLKITLSIPGNAIGADTYAITGEWSNQNYAVTFEGESGGTTGMFTITARPVAITIGNKSGVYGDEPDVSAGQGNVTLTNTSTAANEGIVSGEDIYSVLAGLQLITTATETSDVDDYSITATNGIYGNYNVAFTDGTYTVEPRPITITITDQSSYYGCAVETLGYTVSYTGDSSKQGIVNNDTVTITPRTDATQSRNAGTYAITAEVTGADNYKVTKSGSWKESDANAGKAGTYTIHKATLTIDFANESVNVSMGGNVNNPLEFTNASNSNELLAKQPNGVVVAYTSDDEDIAEVDKDTGAVTIVGPGDATITAEVTDGGQNFEAGSRDQYVIHVAGASTGIQVQATPNTNLVYNGSMQQLLAGYTVNPANADVIFAVTAKESGDHCEIDSNGMPMAQDAGTYRVSWTATLAGYTDVSGWVDVVIDKANPSTGFNPTSVQTTYEENKVYDSTADTRLNVATGYNGAITYLSNHTIVAMVNNNKLTNISINSTGSAVISASFAETENYKAQTVSFTLTVNVAGTQIDFDAGDYMATYDGQPHGANITVNSPSTYTIMYSDDMGLSYSLTESPTITDVGELTIYFQISSPGYTSVDGTQAVKVEPETITSGMVSGIATSYTYTGSQITVDNTLTVANGSTLLVRGTDYKVEYGANTEVGMNGYVKITGIGNYTVIVEEYFEITSVEASHLSASLDRYFGYFGDNATNTAAVTVMHGTHEVTDGITVMAAGADVSGQTVTFNAVGVYKIEVEVAGTHTGSFTLYYTLLPKDSGGDFEIGGLSGSVVTYDGQNHAFTPTVADVDGNQLTDSDYTLTYSYNPFSGTEIAGAAYDPTSTELVEAGLYIITVTGTYNHSGEASVALLIAQRDLADGDVDASITSGLVFTGSAQEPAVTLTYNSTALGNFTTQYLNNVNAGKAQAVSTASADNNNFHGTRVDEFTIAPKSITGFTAVADPAEYNYTGKVIIPTVKVTDSTGAALLLNTDYTVSASAINPGGYKATVKGIGNYTGSVEVDYTILADPGQPVAGLELTVTPAEWTYTATPSVTIHVTHNGSPITDYTLTVEKDGAALVTDGDAAAVIAELVEPGVYTVTANGTGAYTGSADTATVTIHKIQPSVTVTATPATLSGGGKVTLTLSGSNLPAHVTDLSTLLSVQTANGTDLDLSELTWTVDNGVHTAEFDAANANETYTFTLHYPGSDYHHPTVPSTATVVTAQQIISGGIVTPPDSEPDGGAADPGVTGVSGWLITEDHIRYLNGYDTGMFGPGDNMTRAQAAQMFYNLLLDRNVPVTVRFDDVPADAWYAQAVHVLASLGMINGVGNNRFEPDRSITRAEFTAIAMRFAHLDTSGENIFSDVSEDDWFYEQVIGSIKYGWINGYADGTFRPDDTISRAEVTAMVNRMLGRSADRAFVDSHAQDLTQFGDVNKAYWAYYEIMEAANTHDYIKADGTETWK